MAINGIMSVISNPITIIWIFIGVAIGIVFGSLPGLTATMAVTIFLPLTYSMDPIAAISVLMALYIGGTSGGLISAILLNIPGTPASIATCFDGTPMAKNGHADKALGAGVLYSVLGTIFGILAMFFIAPLLAQLAIKFGPYEYCALSIFSLSLIVSLSDKDMLKGFISAIIGITLATVGLAPIDSAQRYTFGFAQLNNGFALLTVLIGLYALSEILSAAENVNSPRGNLYKGNTKIHGFGITWQEFKKQWKNFFSSAIIGTGIGILPGIGGGTSGMLSYSFVKRHSKYPEKFGTGILDGIVASETSNNVTIGGAMIPLLTLGIPGDGTTAILLGALMVHNVTPGPMIFQKNGAVVYGIYTAMIVATIAVLIIEYIGMRGFIKVLKIPNYFLLPPVVVLCFVGAFGNTNRIFDIGCVLCFGFLGYLLHKGGFPIPPLILGFILGPMFEENLRRVSQFQTIDGMKWIEHPIAIVLIIVTIVALMLPYLKGKKARV